MSFAPCIIWLGPLSTDWSVEPSAVCWEAWSGPAGPAIDAITLLLIVHPSQYLPIDMNLQWVGGKMDVYAAPPPTPAPLPPPPLSKMDCLFVRIDWRSAFVLTCEYHLSCVIYSQKSNRYWWEWCVVLSLGEGGGGGEPLSPPNTPPLRPVTIVLIQPPDITHLVVNSSSR